MQRGIEVACTREAQDEEGQATCFLLPPSLPHLYSYLLLLPRFMSNSLDLSDPDHSLLSWELELAGIFAEGTALSGDFAKHLSSLVCILG